MCTVLLPLGENPIVVNKYIISYHIINKGRILNMLQHTPAGTRYKIST